MFIGTGSSKKVRVSPVHYCVPQGPALHLAHGIDTFNWLDGFLIIRNLLEQVFTQDRELASLIIFSKSVRPCYGISF